jgi:hypothetical protein
MKTILIALLLMTTIISMTAQCQLPNQINGQTVKEFFVIDSTLYVKVVGSDISILITDSSGQYSIAEHIYNSNGVHVVKLVCGSTIPVKNKTNGHYGITNELDLAGLNLRQSGGLILGGMGVAVLGTSIGLIMIKSKPEASIGVMGAGVGVGGVMIISGIAKLINGGNQLSRFGQRFDVGYYGTGGTVKIKL